MSDALKFKTFKDLKSVPSSFDKSKSEVTHSINDNQSSTSISSRPSISRTTSLPRTSPSVLSDNETSPTKDFQKVPNSIAKNLDLFRGKSKQVWDYLWSVSRAAYTPTRFIKKSRREIKEGSNLGSMVTLDAAIEHLENVGLLIKLSNIGSQQGNQYEIFTPEEALSSTRYTSISSISHLYQKVDVLDIPVSGISSTGQIEENKATYSDPKTFFKTNTKNDDDDARASAAFLVMAKRLDAAVKKITGKGVSKADAEKWGNLADLLILELEIAASRADGVSNVPAFLTEVLRRQFFASRQQQAAVKSSKTKPDTVGKSETDSYEIKSLDEKGRDAALVHLREFTDDDFLEDFAKWYTAEDWTWLIRELKK